MVKTFDDIVIPEEPIVAQPAPPVPPGTDDDDNQPDTDDNDGVEAPAPAPGTSFEERVDPLDIDDADADDKDDAGDDADIYVSVAEILKSKGFFSGIDKVDDVKSSDKLAEYLDKEVQARLTDRQREIMEYMNKGVSISQVDHIKQAIADIAPITPEALVGNEELMEDLVLADMRYKGFDEATANSFLEMMKSSDKLQVEAVKALHTRKQTLNGLLQEEVQGAEARKQAEVAQQQETLKKLQEKMHSKEIFGRKLGDTTIEKLNKLATTPVAYTKEGQPLNAIMKYRMDDPLDFEHKLLYLFTVTNNFKDLNAFDRSAESRVSQKLRSAVMRSGGSEALQNQTVKNINGAKIDIDSIDDVI